MRLLGIDTSGPIICIGLSDNDKIYAYNLEVGIRHSQVLLPVLRRILNYLDWDIKDIDYFGCGLGPGSFTGLRIGLSTIKGLAWARQRPIIGIPTLDIIAAALRERYSRIIVAMDARRNSVYCCQYHLDKQQRLKHGRYLLLSKEEFIKSLPQVGVISGDAIILYRKEILERAPHLEIADRHFWYAQGYFLIELMQERIKQGKFDDVLRLNPLYIYPRDCQVRRIQDERK